jgi:hypothetical protein
MKRKINHLKWTVENIFFKRQSFRDFKISNLISLPLKTKKNQIE